MTLGSERSMTRLTNSRMKASLFSVLSETRYRREYDLKERREKQIAEGLRTEGRAFSSSLSAPEGAEMLDFVTEGGPSDDRPRPEVLIFPNTNCLCWTVKLLLNEVKY